jgi:transcriptional regulator with XRE-family HTH domain
MPATMPPKEYRFFFKLLGVRVRHLRLARAWTQEQMSEFGFSLRHYQQIEFGRPINLETALRLADAFSVDISKLFKGLSPMARKLAAEGASDGGFAPRPRGRPKRRRTRSR